MNKRSPKVVGMRRSYDGAVGTTGARGRVEGWKAETGTIEYCQMI